MKSELFCIFRESLLRNLRECVCIHTSLEPVHGRSENNFILLGIFSIISLTVCSNQTRTVSVYLVFDCDTSGRPFEMDEWFPCMQIPVKLHNS